jgi:hypothetical protein
MLADAIFTSVTISLHKHFPNVTRAEFDSILADPRRSVEDALADALDRTINLDNVIDIVATRFFGED